MNRIFQLLVAAFVAVSVASCAMFGGSSSQSSPQGGGGGAASSATQNAVIVTITNNAFQPASLTVPAGTTVTFINQDAGAHTVSALDGSWSSGLLRQGDTFSVTFDHPGTYTYNDQVHPQVTGTVVVQ